MIEADLVVDAGNLLGEGLAWDARSEALWWVDIAGMSLHRLAGGAYTVWQMPAKPGALAPATDGRLLVALASGFAWFTPEEGSVGAFVDPEPDLPGNRLNDGCTDRRGRFWCGSMDDAEVARTGRLHRLDPDGNVTTHLDGIGIPNSTAFSPDGRTMYFADTLDRVIYAFDYDPDTGTPSRSRVLAEVPEPGYPDGSAVDDDGCLWNAEWGGGRLVRYTPAGSVERIVPLPVERPTCCAFGGSDRATLFVTSDRRNLDERALGLQPHAGGLLALDAGIAGPAAVPFG